MAARTNGMTWLAVALVVAIGLMVILGAVTMTNYGGSYGMMGNGTWAWGLLMMGIPAVFLIVILLAALGGLSEPPPLAVGPLDILEQRYARGELTREDYLRIRDDLRRGPNGP